MAKDNLACEDTRQEGGLLVLGTVDHDGGPGQAQAHPEDVGGYLEMAFFLEPDDLLHHTAPKPTIFPGPGDGAIAIMRLGGLVAPRPRHLVGFDGTAQQITITHGIAPPLEMLLEPGACLAPKGLFLWGVVEIHGRLQDQACSMLTIACTWTVSGAAPLTGTKPHP